MAVELRVPEVGESITEVQIGAWLKEEGQHVQQDEAVVEIESDKATLELPAPASGIVSRVVKKKGENAQVGDIIGYLEEGAAPAAGEAQPEEKPEPEATPEPAARSEAAQSRESNGKSLDVDATGPDDGSSASPQLESGEPVSAPVMPSAQRILKQEKVEARQVEGTGPGGRVLKEDAMRAAEAARQAPSQPAPPPTGDGQRHQETVPLSPMRRTIAERLVEAQQTAALLTTFNEVDMTAVKELRSRLQPQFQEKYGVKLGFMSFFVKAAVDALKQFPRVNAYIEDDSIIYNSYQDIGIAVGGGKGLVVPVLRNAELMSFAEVELTINDFAQRAQQNKIGLEELKGGTFSISNGGVYGSLLSTPIVNPPQSGILGLHAIQDRPTALDGQVVVRPMMYVALTYDHRLVDGREAVTFLKRIKECIEDPARMLLEV